MVPHTQARICFLFTVEVIGHTPDLHAIVPHHYYSYWESCHQLTAFTSVLYSAVYSPSLGGHRTCDKECVDKIVRVWLEALRQAGVDLNIYGQREYKLFAKEEVSRDFHFTTVMFRGGHYNFSIRLIGFKYGPKPEDWKVYFDERTDRFAGEFWELVENSLLQIPGSWVDDDDDDDDFV